MFYIKTFIILYNMHMVCIPTYKNIKIVWKSCSRCMYPRQKAATLIYQHNTLENLLMLCDHIISIYILLISSNTVNYIFNLIYANFMMVYVYILLCPFYRFYLVKTKLRTKPLCYWFI